MTFTPFNTAPILGAISDRTINENVGLQTVGLSGFGDGEVFDNQVLTMTAASANTALISTPSVVYTSPSVTDSLSFTTVDDATGTTTVSVTVTDGISDTSRSFTVIVNAAAAGFDLAGTSLTLDILSTTPYSPATSLIDRLCSHWSTIPAR